MTDTPALREALQEVIDQLDDYGPDGVGFRSAIDHARRVLARLSVNEGGVAPVEPYPGENEIDAGDGKTYRFSGDA